MNVLYTQTINGAWVHRSLTVGEVYHLSALLTHEQLARSRALKRQFNDAWNQADEIWAPPINCRCTVTLDRGSEITFWGFDDDHDYGVIARRHRAERAFRERFNRAPWQGKRR